MSKFLKSLFLLLTAGVFAATGWAVDPIATWTNFKNLETQNGVSLSLNGNRAAEDGSSVTIGGEAATNGLTIDYEGGMTVVMEVSDIPVGQIDGKSIVLWSAIVSNHTHFLQWDGSKFQQKYDSVANIYGESVWSANSARHILVFRTGGSDGTFSYLDGVCIASGGGLKWNGATVTGITVGAYSENTSVTAATGMKVHRIELYNSFLDVTTIKSNYDTYFNGLTEYAAEIATSKNASELEWPDGVTLAQVSTNKAKFTVSNSPTLTIDSNLSSVGLTVDGTGVLTIATDGTNKLTSSGTIINTDTTVEAGAASLGAVTVVADKILTVNDQALSVIAGGAGTLKTRGDISLGAFGGTVKLVVASGTFTQSDKLGENHDIVIADGATFEANGYGNYITKSIQLAGKLQNNRRDGEIDDGKIRFPNISVTGANAKIGGSQNFGTTARSHGNQNLCLNGNTLEKVDGNTFTLSSVTFRNQGASDTTPAGTVKITGGKIDLHSGSNTSSGQYAAFVMNGGTLDIANKDYSVGSLSGTSNVILGAKTLTVGALNEDSAYSGILSGTGAVTKVGTGALILSGVNTTTGALNVNVGCVNLTGTWTGDVDVVGKIVGAGSIKGKLKLEDGATLDVSEGALNVTDEVWVMGGVDNTATVKPPKKYGIGTPIVTCSNASTVATELSSKMPEGYTCVAVGNTIKLAKTDTDSLDVVVPAGGSLTYSEVAAVVAAAGGAIADTTTLTINFGDKGESEATPGTFTFDTDNTGAVSIAQIIVNGTNGGMITKTGAGAVSVTATTIQEGCSVTVPASTAILGAVDIETKATLSVADTATVTSVTGAGTLICDGILPTNTTGLTTGTAANGEIPANGCWTGTVTLANNTDVSSFDADVYGNAASTVELKNIGSANSMGFHFENLSSPKTYKPTLKISGDVYLRNGNESDTYTFNNLIGDGTFVMANAPANGHTFNFMNASNFKGAFKIEKDTHKIVVGNGSAEAGKIVIAAPVTIAKDKTWTAAKGITVTDSGSVAGEGTLECDGTSTLRSLNGINLKVNANATATVTGNSTVSTIAGTGSLTVQGKEQATSTLILNGESTFGGVLSVGNHATLRLAGVTNGEVKTPASLTVKKTLSLSGNASLVTMTPDYNAMVTIATDATIIPNSVEHYSAKMSLQNDATIDLSAGGYLCLNAIDLPAGKTNQEVNGVIKVIPNSVGTIVRTVKGLPIDLLVNNFELVDEVTNLYVHLRSNEVVVVQIDADMTGLSDLAKQAIMDMSYGLYYYPIHSIQNADVVDIFTGSYDDGSYGFTYGYTSGEDGDQYQYYLNIYYYVRFGISDISNVRVQDDGTLWVNVTAKVEPFSAHEGVEIAFQENVTIALYLEGENDPLETVTIKKDNTDVREVVFKNVQLPAFDKGTGTHKLTVRATRSMQQ